MKRVPIDRDIAGENYKESLSNALRLCYELRLEEAENILNMILDQYPSTCDGYSALALIQLMQGRPDQQRSLLEQSLIIDPSHYASLHQLAIVHFRAGQFSEAYDQAKRALAQKPDSQSTLLLASRICLALHNSKEAFQLAEKTLRQSKDWHPQATNQMALALIQGNSHDVLCDSVVESIMAGNGDQVSLDVANYLIQVLRVDEHHLKLCNQRLAVDPDNRFLRLLRIRLLASKGQHDDCFSDLYYLLSLEPDNPITLHHFAEAFLALKRYRNALQVFLKIARINSANHLLLNQIGVCFRCTGRFRSSEKAFWRSIKLNPLDAYIINNLGEINFRFGDFKRAFALYRIALNINPSFKDAFYNRMLCLSVGEPHGMAEMRKESAAFWTSYKELSILGDGIQEKAVQNKLCNANDQSSPASCAKARIGILTSDIGNHCVSYFLTSFLRYYNKERFHIELILCDRRYEEREREICSYVDHAQSLEGLSESDARDVIRKLSLDLIIECNGYTGGSGISILAERCAPIQCHYIGYHASTGLDTIDYFISDKHILSASVAEQLSEKPLKLDRAWLAFSKFEEFPRARSTAKVNRPLLGFFGNSTKITDITLEYWSALFHACPGAILVLKCLSYTDRYIVEKVLGRLESHGIKRSHVAILEPTASWKDHLDYYNIIDYALDSTPWSSATTGFEALGMGVPLLAIQGETIASRMSSSLVSHLGHSEWISVNPSGYASLGNTIVSDYIKIRKQKEHLQAEVLNSSLFDGPNLAKSLEKALLQVLEHAAPT